MKKVYENVKMEIVFFLEEDVLTGSKDFNESQDNIESMPDFPEVFG